MCVLGAFPNQQQLGCLADTAVWLLSESIEWNTVMLEFIDNHLILFKKATSMSVDQKCIFELALASDFPRRRKGLFIVVLACFSGWGIYNCIGKNTCSTSRRVRLISRVFFISPRHVIWDSAGWWEFTYSRGKDGLPLHRTPDCTVWLRLWTDQIQWHWYFLGVMTLQQEPASSFM